MLRRSEGSGIPQGEPQGRQKWFQDGSSLTGQPQIQRVHQASAQSTEAPTAPASPNSPLHLQLRDFLGKNCLISLDFIFLHGIFLHKFVQLPFEPICNPTSTTSCGRTFQSFSALCVCFELPGSCQEK